MKFKIKEAREKAGYSQKELAQIIGVAPNTFHGYESGKHDPKSELLTKIAQACNVSVDFLLDHTTETHLNIKVQDPDYFSIEETEHIKKYRTLDKYGKETVSGVLEFEFKRCREQEKDEIADSTEPNIIYLPDPIQSASAGYGQLADDDTANMIAIKANPITSKANYIMRVSGDSMEPKFFDGQRVLVRNQPTLQPGEIGIFLIDGERFIKIYRGDHLESANPDYSDVQFDEYSKCLGKVLGVLKDEWIIN